MNQKILYSLLGAAVLIICMLLCIIVYTTLRLTILQSIIASNQEQIDMLSTEYGDKISMIDRINHTALSDAKTKIQKNYNEKEDTLRNFYNNVLSQEKRRPVSVLEYADYGEKVGLFEYRHFELFGNEGNLHFEATLRPRYTQTSRVVTKIEPVSGNFDDVYISFSDNIDSYYANIPGFYQNYIYFSTNTFRVNNPDRLLQELPIGTDIDIDFSEISFEVLYTDTSMDSTTTITLLEEPTKQ